jgi:hypothetical protein
MAFSLERHQPWHCTHTEAGDTQRKPEVHNLLDLVSRRRIGHIESRLKLVEPMVLIELNLFIIAHEVARTHCDFGDGFPGLIAGMGVLRTA